MVDFLGMNIADSGYSVKIWQIDTKFNANTAIYFLSRNIYKQNVCNKSTQNKQTNNTLPNQSKCPFNNI